MTPVIEKIIFSSAIRVIKLVEEAADEFRVPETVPPSLILQFKNPPRREENLRRNMVNNFGGRRREGYIFDRILIKIELFCLFFALWK